MQERRKVILTVMVMVVDKSNNKILVLNRLKNDWPGLTFPGGHVEDDESIEECAIRETKEETGLTISNLVNKGYYEWNNEFNDNLRHLSILFTSDTYKGSLKNSSEGEVFFISLNELNNYKLSNDFDKILKKIML